MLLYDVSTGASTSTTSSEIITPKKSSCYVVSSSTESLNSYVSFLDAVGLYFDKITL